MKIIRSYAECTAMRRNLVPAHTCGFVPTMGNLHQGHAALIKRSLAFCTQTVVSIFINPTQFNQESDFKNYPNTLAADLTLLETLGVAYCLLPEVSALYPDEYCYQLHENKCAHVLEGQSRPGHFTGVLTVVMKLLQWVQPTHAFFGEKDYQQLLLIQGMVKAFFLPVNIIACPTVRESSGLAYSSRNNRLTAEEKKRAELFAHIFHTGSSCETIQAALQGAGIVWDYVTEYNNRRYAAVYIGSVRLIDNYALDSACAV